MIIYSTKILEIGLNADEFLNGGMIVLFGFDAPPELRPYCFLINKNELKDSIEVGDIFLIDESEYKIIAVGEQVNKNLRDLGHITIDFRGEIENIMAGSLYVEQKPITNISIGTKITIKNNKVKDE
ncbi:PTS system, glucitol/sorbitol-specific IIA component [Clostridium sp. USBA 49]|uniref:PTS glucitol/sorbitol transporter subunit IIA n=1 Tax=Clostridium sp. USBA 49 TaxID=1881060 RepID=UPI00099A0D76|nr:PTS glucitol/sorbitol transporter subunit IIA [Clostridium sp. USBA 49]SKA79099.1 PTS system, glucitol/sorbitol-specific IIA component [Clostridium sp. USBA 49]